MDASTIPMVANIAALLNLGKGLVNLPPTGLTCPLYPWLLWYLWKARNLLLFKDRMMQEHEIITLEIKGARVWQADQLMKELHVKVPHAVGAYQVPNRTDAGMLCLVDASWQASTHFGGMGWIFKDSTSAWSLSNTINHSHVASALVSEALAVKAAICDAASRNIRALRVCSDAKTLMDCINSRSQSLEIQCVLNDILALCASFESMSFQFISSTFNTEADSLAKISLQDLVSRTIAI